MSDRTHVLVVAAGRGTRAGAGVPKQFRALAGTPVIARTLGIFLSRDDIASVVPVIHQEDAERFAQVASALAAIGAGRLAEPTIGGDTRQDSVFAGLEALDRSGARPDDVVLIHDGARPFASLPLVDRAIASARRHGAAIPCCPVVDTLKEVDASGRIVGAADRARLRAVQTPQAFVFDLIVKAHRRARAEGCRALTDDAAVAEFAGHEVFTFEGETANGKITTADDLDAAERQLMHALPDIRTGQGFDVHSFGEGDAVTLGGVRIPHARGLAGHSDADVVLHALTDAVLAAIGEGDIGTHFPPSEARWKGAASAIFLQHAADLVRRRGGMIASLNATLVCEEPRIGPHREAMRSAIGAAAGIAPDRVSLTATTSEGLGFTGRREGIVAWGLATVRLPLGPA